MSLSEFSFEIKDVYDLAYDIAQEFETIINLVTSEEITPLINKVIRILELLEESVKKLDDLENENSDLKSQFAQLSSEKIADTAEKLNLKLAFEDLEESWIKESTALKSLITKLKSENTVLKQALVEKKNPFVSIDDSYKEIIEDQERLIAKLKTNLQQRDDQLQKDQTEVEVLNSKIEHLIKSNKSLQMKCTETKTLLTSEVIAKSDSDATVRLQQQQLLSLKMKFDAVKKSLSEKSESSFKGSKGSTTKSYLTEEAVNSLLEEHQNLKEKVLELQSELTLVKIQNEECKKKLLMTSKSPLKQPDKKDSHIQQIFRLFLGIVNVSPEMGVYRGF